MAPRVLVDVDRRSAGRISLAWLRKLGPMPELRMGRMLQHSAPRADSRHGRKCAPAVIAELVSAAGRIATPSFARWMGDNWPRAIIHASIAIFRPKLDAWYLAIGPIGDDKQAGHRQRLAWFVRDFALGGGYEHARLFLSPSLAVGIESSQSRPAGRFERRAAHRHPTPALQAPLPPDAADPGVRRPEGCMQIGTP